MLCIFRSVLLALLIVIPSSAYAIDEGKPAPAFTANLIDGKPFSIESVKGQVVIINFWATWCPPCRQEMPEFEHYYQ